MNLSIFLYIILALLAGVCFPAQAGVNAKLSSLTGSPILASIVTFIGGTIALIVFGLYLRIITPPLAEVITYPAWVWLGGLLGAFGVTVMIILAPKLGATTMLAFVLAGQMLAALVLDHFGLLGFAQHPINLAKLTGTLLILGGAVLVKFSTS